MMMTLGAARRAKVLAHVVPVLVSLLLLLVFGAALPGLPGSLGVYPDVRTDPRR